MIATRDENTSEANAGTTRGYSDNDIAVVGIAGQFPMADDLEQFWEAVKNGKDCVGDLPRSRREDWLPFYSEEALDDISQFGFLERINRFDARFFGISPVEAQCMDPQQRLLLEVAWEALEHAGQSVEALA
ncbi:MAG: hypothetical protein GY950_32125, partial [bacterium]|nr:hypothetical protein [bacterium]